MRDRDASILATEIRTTPEHAALANGILAHALDYDDHGHASTQSSLPAALALGEARHVSGKELLLAYIVGREVCFHLTKCLDSEALAANGYTADETILTSSGGFADVYSVAPGATVATVDKLTQHLQIVEHGIGVKRYPSCSPTHGYINAMRILKEKYGFTAETVEAIACSPSRSLRCLYPKTGLGSEIQRRFQPGCDLDRWRSQSTQLHRSLFAL